MKGKVIYVDFIKKHRITLVRFILNKLVNLLSKKFNTSRTRYKKDIYMTKKKRISN